MPSAETLPNMFYTLVLASMLCGPSATQTVSGSITDTVVDPSDAVIPGVAITLTNEQTGQVRHTAVNTRGEFVFTALPPGTYKVSIEAQTSRRTGIVLPADARVTASIAHEGQRGRQSSASSATGSEPVK